MMVSSIQTLLSLLNITVRIIFTADIPQVFYWNEIDASDATDLYNFSLAEIERLNSLSNNKFPDDFYFGVASSAYECEGAWNVSDKSESVWDYMTHSNSNLILDHSNGDVSSDFYHKYAHDIQLASNIGLTMMRISLSWSRILPNGYDNYVSSSGVQFYNNVINEMIANNITPMVSLFDQDMPYSLQQLGGWTNPVIIDIFADYANVVFTLFGDKVKYWATVNDAVKMCRYGYGGTVIPAMNLSGFADYLCGHHVLLAHAKVYELYHRKYSETGGKLGILNYYTWFVPAQNSSESDIFAANMAHIFYNDWLTQPIFSFDGDYPQIMRSMVAYESYTQDFTHSRLPVLSPSDIRRIKGSADFLGINYYTTTTVESNVNAKVMSFNNDAKFRSVENTDWVGEMNIKNTPWALRKLLHRLYKDYLLPEIWITGNGYADSGGITDWGRTLYHHNHLEAVLKTMQDGIDIKGYLVKTLTDGFEGMDGYKAKFGLLYVDFDDFNRTRLFKLSMAVIKDVCTTKTLRSAEQVFDAFAETLNL